MNEGTIILIIWLIFITIIAITLYKRGMKALSIFPDINSVRILFKDTSASGYSTKNWKTKFGGSSRSLHIIITEDELWLKSNLLLSSIGEQYDLLHKIPRSRITKIEPKGRKNFVEFESELGEKKEVVLVTNYQESFLKTLKN